DRVLYAANRTVIPIYGNSNWRPFNSLLRGQHTFSACQNHIFYDRSSTCISANHKMRHNTRNTLKYYSTDCNNMA
ncbi:hypothetical protein ALC62_09893, partial [Cyphomyrmex costatus]